MTIGSYVSTRRQVAADFAPHVGVRCVKQYLEVLSHQTTFQCLSPGVPVYVRDGGNPGAESACCNHPIVNIHRDGTTDKSSSDVVLGCAHMVNVNCIWKIWVYESLLCVVREPNFLFIHKVFAAGTTIRRSAS